MLHCEVASSLAAGMKERVEGEPSRSHSSRTPWRRGREGSDGSIRDSREMEMRLYIARERGAVVSTLSWRVSLKLPQMIDFMHNDG